jgi:hypothetical protein
METFYLKHIKEITYTHGRVIIFFTSHSTECGSFSARLSLATFNLSVVLVRLACLDARLALLKPLLQSQNNWYFPFLLMSKYLPQV